MWFCYIYLIKRINIYEMHKRLAENGLRYIRGKVIGSVEEAIEFYDAESLGEVVIKPIRSAGSCNVRICLNKQEMIDAIEDIMGMEGYLAEMSKNF